MGKAIFLKQEVPYKGEFDVIVAGGGVAGVAAAVSAARRGRSVLLIEKSIALGGLATIGLINFFVPMCNGRGTQIIKGMAEELLRLSIRYGWDTIPEEWKNGDPGEGAKARYCCRYSAPIFTLALTEFVQDAGVTLLFDSIVTDPVMEEGHCRGVIVENKGGRAFYEAKVVVDTTGDADIMHRAGVPTLDGKNYFTFLMKGLTLSSMQKAVEAGEVSRAYVGVSGGGVDLYGHNQPQNVPLYKGTTAEEITDYIERNHKIALERMKGQNPRERDILQMPSMCQFRETRRIVGDETLSGDDVYKHFNTSIGAICDFELRDRLYEIPYGALVHTGFDNLITAGRTISGEGWGWDVTRVIPPAIITGQAAGEAAHLSLENACSITDIPVAALQQTLEKENVIIHFDDALIPENRTEAVRIDVGEN